MPFTPSKDCPTPGCPNQGGPRGGPCVKCRQRRRQGSQKGARERGYAEGWDADFLHHYPLCYHRVEKRCTMKATLADHYPRSRKELAAAGVSEENLNDWQYLVPSCDPCHRYHTARRQPGGWNRPGWRRSA